MASGARMDQVDLQITTTGKEIAMVQQNIEQVEAALEGNGVYKGIRDRVHLVARLGSFEKEKEQLRRKEEQLNERLNLLLRAGQTAAASGELHKETDPTHARSCHPCAGALLCFFPVCYSLSHSFNDRHNRNSNDSLNRFAVGFTPFF